MSASLDIFFPADDSQSVYGKYYAATGSSPDDYGDETTLREIVHNPAFRLHTESVRLFIPGEWVSLHRTDIPAAGKRQAGKLLPALLEEDVGEDIESLHFALLAFEGNQAIVAVIAQQKMQQITAWMQATGIASRTVLPDWMAQACESMLIEGGRCLFRAAPWLGWSCPLSLAPVLLAAQLPLDQHSFEIFYNDERPSALTALLEANHAIRLYQQAPVPRAEIFTGSLLWGEWKPRADYRLQWQQWRKVIYSIGACLLLLTVERGLALWSLQAQVQQSHQWVEKRFQQLFPTQKRIVNLRAQVNAALRNSSQQPAEEEMITLLRGGNAGRHAAANRYYQFKSRPAATVAIFAAARSEL